MIKCVIIEDEQHAANYLTYLLARCDYKIEVLTVIDTLADATTWLATNEPDLIFMDIQLGDGNSFSLFNTLKIDTPIIFTTSYSNYAIEAFKVNSISYLLKPFELDDLNNALHKFFHLRSPQDQDNQESTRYQKRFLVSLPNSLRVLNDDDIAYFMVQNRHVFIVLNTGESLLFDNTLEALEEKLNPDLFFRINRQFIVRRGAIQNMFNETRGRVRIETGHASREEMIVSIDRSNEFKEWLR
jgi:DNA-binding LytR/AlgR family response regulator